MRFPHTDLAAIARGYGCDAVDRAAARRLDPVRGLAGRPAHRPLLVDAKVAAGQPSWWLEEAFRGH